MKTKFIGVIVATMLIILAAANIVNAASIKVEPNKVEKDQEIKVTIKTSAPVESMGFTLSYDKTMAKYTGYESKIGYVDVTENSTGIKVGAAGTATDTMVLKFKALKTGNVNFTIGGDMEFITSDDKSIDTTFPTPTVKTEIIEMVNVKIGEKTYKIQKGAKLNTISELSSFKVAEGKTFVNFTDATGKVIADDAVINNDIVLTANFKTNETKPVTPEETTKPQEPSKEEEKPSDTKVDTDKKDETTSGKYVGDDGKEIKKLIQTGSVIPSVVLIVVMAGLMAGAIYKATKINK